MRGFGHSPLYLSAGNASCGCHQQTLSQSASALPSGAIGYVDFAAGTYFFGESLDLDDVFGNSSPSYYPDPINPAHISANGWEPPMGQNYFIGFIGALAAQVLAGATVVLDATLAAPGRVEVGLAHVATNEPYLAAMLDTAEESCGLTPDGTNTITEFPGTQGAGRHKMAATFIEDRISGSVDGGAVIADTTPWANAPDTCGFGLTPQIGLFVASLVIYPPQDDADLPTLSAL
jgi:hypothetical protein